MGSEGRAPHISWFCILAFCLREGNQKWMLSEYSPKLSGSSGGGSLSTSCGPGTVLSSCMHDLIYFSPPSLKEVLLFLHILQMNEANAESG